MAFPIIPKRRSGAAGNPSSLQLGELAVNTLDGELYLGGDGGVMLLNGPVAAGTTATEHTGDGTTTAFLFGGYNGTADGGYLVSVGGIDQPPSKYSVSATAGGTLTFVEAPVAGELISIRAIVAGSGGGGDGNAIQIQGRDVASTAPTNGQVLAWNATTSKWEPQGGGGTVTFDTVGTHLWSVPASVRYASVMATSGNGSGGTATAGAIGSVGTRAYFDENGIPVNATPGANGSDGTASAGNAGKEVSIPALSFSLAGGTAGLAGLFGYGGGGGGGGAIYDATFGFIAGAAGSNGSGPDAGFGGEAATANSNGNGGAAGGDGASPGSGATAGTGEFAPAGNGGGGGTVGAYQGGGGGGGANRSGGGGGGAAYPDTTFLADVGQPGTGGIADTSMCAGGAGGSFTGALNFAAYAGGQVAIVISEGAGNASITITW